MILYYINSAQKTISDKKINNTPIFKGWYAYPEGVVFEKRYCVYTTFSAGYGKQVFLDAFSSFDLTHWKKASENFRYNCCEMGEKNYVCTLSH